MCRRLFALLLVLGSLQCASSSPSGQGVPVITDPSGATATAAGQTITTPGTLVVPEGAREMEIRIDKAGFQTEFVLLTPTTTSVKDCIDNATLSPNRGGGGISGSPGVEIGEAALRVAARCSSSAGLLEPTMVFVKLQSTADIAPTR